MKVQRALEDVEADLSQALQNKTINMLAVGRLLNEAKDLVDHGKWGSNCGCQAHEHPYVSASPSYQSA